MIVYSLHTHRHDLLPHQHALVYKHVAGVTGFVVVNNGPDGDEIEKTAKRLGANFLSCPRPKEDNMSFMTASALTIALGHHATGRFDSHIDDVMPNALVIDMDVFPFAPCDPSAWLKDHSFASAYCISGNVGNEHSPWPGLMAIRRDIPFADNLQFDPASIRGCWCDCGAAIIVQMANQPGFQWNKVGTFENLSADDLPEHLREQFDPAFGFSRVFGWLHTSKATNWDLQPEPFVARKNKLLFEYLDYLKGQ